MIKSIIVDKPDDSLLSLERMLSHRFHEIYICGKAKTLTAISKLVNDMKPELVFINVNLLLHEGIDLNKYFKNVNYEIVFISDTDNYVIDAINCSACGYLIKPFQKKHLNNAVNNALLRISLKQDNSRNKILVEKYFKQSCNEDVIGIPTIEGFEFISINEIIRCEGLQKCTRVITKERTDIISSYNLGEFRKLLEPYGFYSPHKSHLINLKYIRKYHREGNILMINDSFVPVAKRKKREFLNHVKHI